MVSAHWCTPSEAEQVKFTECPLATLTGPDGEVVMFNRVALLVFKETRKYKSRNKLKNLGGSFFLVRFIIRLNPTSFEKPSEVAKRSHL